MPVATDHLNDHPKHIVINFIIQHVEIQVTPYVSVANIIKAITDIPPVKQLYKQFLQVFFNLSHSLMLWWFK